METVSTKPKAPAQHGVYPPSFCRWKLLLTVMGVALASTLLMAVGGLRELSLPWLLKASVYGQGLALFTALGVCTCRTWLNRLSARGAWVGSWLVAAAAALAFSYSAGIVGTVLGAGPGRENFGMFVGQSVLAVALVSVVLFRYLFVRAQWYAQHTARSEARVQALQARMRPHFLFNCLNTIASLIPEDPAGAERATEDLADLFRGSLRRADRLISLSDELQLAGKYLEMERRRLGERLGVDWQVSDLPEGASILPLTLQPLLENAVAHGIQARTHGGRIRVYGRGENDKVVITISNPLGTQPRDSGGHGMALANIRERLELAFGQAASLVTHSNGEQFFAVLSLPYVENIDR